MKPLESITILEFSTMITASLASMMMGEQGARVIKVEPMAMGDPMRYIGARKADISALFANCNRGKESLRIDLKSDEGVRVIKEMIPSVDVVIHNFRPGVMDKLGLGSETLRTINPRIKYGFSHLMHKQPFVCRLGFLHSPNHFDLALLKPLFETLVAAPQQLNGVEQSARIGYNLCSAFGNLLLEFLPLCFGGAGLLYWILHTGDCFLGILQDSLASQDIGVLAFISF